MNDTRTTRTELPSPTFVIFDMRKRTWIIIGSICAVIIALIIVTVLVVTITDEDEETILFESGSYEETLPHPFNATWISGNELFYQDSSRHLVLLNVKKQRKMRKIFSLWSDMKGDESFELSADRKYLKVHYKLNKKYEGKVTIIKLENKEHTDLTVNGKSTFLLFVWSPKGNAFAVVCGRNIFYKPSVESKAIQITEDYDNETIYNGVTVWMYEKEVFKNNEALWFSTDGTKMVYAKFDEKFVSKMILVSYRPGEQYPESDYIRYPKAGTSNPLVSLHWINLQNTGDFIILSAPTEEYTLLGSVSWVRNDTVVAVWQNRIQNEASFVYYTIAEESYRTNTLLDVKQQSGWLHFFEPPFFSVDGEMVAVILPFKEGESETYPHVALLSSVGVEDLSKGRYVVTKILGWNWGVEEIFYLANTPEDSSVQHLYVVTVFSRQVKCLSCGLKSKNKKVDCLYNDAIFSKDASHYSLICGGPDVPDISIHSLKKKILDWSENNQLKNERFPKTKTISFKIGSGFKADVQLKLPPDIIENSHNMYPLLVSYSISPGSAHVTQKYDNNFGSYLATTKGVIYAVIDGRGSGLKGDSMKYAVYTQLGTVEIDDQINVTKQILNSFCYIDPDRTAILGMEDYGGYVSGMVLAKDKNDVFKCGISLAPITNWMLHNSIYTERYMKDPQHHSEAYAAANLLSQNYRNKKILLIHGVNDHDVHFQHSLLWSKVLLESGASLKQLFYPDEDHSFSGVRPHLYRSIEEFLDECFLKNDTYYY